MAQELQVLFQGTPGFSVDALLQWWRGGRIGIEMTDVGVLVIANAPAVWSNYKRIASGDQPQGLTYAIFPGRPREKQFLPQVVKGKWAVEEQAYLKKSAGRHLLLSALPSELRLNINCN